MWLMPASKLSSTEASRGCQQKQCVGGGGVQHTTFSPGTALMYPPARQQYAVHSAVIQSLAPERQMVSPMIRLMYPPGAAETFSPWDEMLTNLKQLFQAEIKAHCAFVHILLFFWAGGGLFHVKPSQNAEQWKPVGLRAPKWSFSKQMPAVVPVGVNEMKLSALSCRLIVLIWVNEEDLKKYYYYSQHPENSQHFYIFIFIFSKTILWICFPTA